MTHNRSIVCAAVAGLCVTPFSAPVFAQDQSRAAFTMVEPTTDTGPANVGAGTLANLPATVDQLTFSGESGARQFAVYVMPLETTKPAKLVLSYQSTVSIMPESSSMRVFVNDLPVGDTRLGAGGPETLTVDLAPGMLQPGFNQIRVVVDQHHRVDCSIAGTYELWTAIDPVRSGLAFEGVTPGVEGIEDIPALSRLNMDGVTAIHTVLPAGASSNDIERVMSAAQSAILMGKFENPVVTFGPTSKNAALEIVVGTLATLPNANANWMAGNTPFPSVTFEPKTDADPARLVIIGTTAEELDRSLKGLAVASQKHKPAGTAAGLRALTEIKGVSMSSGEAATLKDLGMVARQFSGRFYQEQMNFQLPADFYPADYADGSLALNAIYAAELASDAQLVVRANNRVVSTIALSSNKRGMIENQKLRVPLGTLRPGKNVLSFEANLPNASDTACDPTVQANPPARLFISDTSSLTIPSFARVGHVPDLSAMTSGGQVGDGGNRGLSVLTKALDPSHLDIAGTFVAKMSASIGTNFDTRFLTTMPHEETGDLIAFGTFADLPPELLAAVRLASPDQILAAAPESGLVIGSAEASEQSAGWASAFDPGQSLAETAAIGTAKTAAGFQNFLASFSQSDDVATRVAELGSNIADAAFALAGFEQNPMTGRVDPTKFHGPDSDASLVIAQGPAPRASGAAWTVVAAKDVKSLGSSVALLTSTTRWDEIDGAVSSMRGDAGIMQSVVAVDEHLFETQPRTFSNLRLVVAGWFSRHLESYVLALLLSCLMLGITTYLFLRNIGERRR